MKQPKKPTRSEKELLSANRLNAKNWLVKEKSDGYIIFVNKLSGKERSICTY